MEKTSLNCWKKVLETERHPCLIGTAKETKVVECGQSRYEYKMKKIDGCHSTTIGTEWSRMKNENTYGLRKSLQR